MQNTENLLVLLFLLFTRLCGNSQETDEARMRMYFQKKFTEMTCSGGQLQSSNVKQNE